MNDSRPLHTWTREERVILESFRAGRLRDELTGEIRQIVESHLETANSHTEFLRLLDKDDRIGHKEVDRIMRVVPKL